MLIIFFYFVWLMVENMYGYLDYEKMVFGFYYYDDDYYYDMDFDYYGDNVGSFVQ